MPPLLVRALVPKTNGPIRLSDRLNQATVSGAVVSEEDAGDLLWVAVGRRRADSLPCGGVDKGFLAPGVARFEQAEISYSDKTTDDVDLCMVAFEIDQDCSEIAELDEQLKRMGAMMRRETIETTTF